MRSQIITPFEQKITPCEQKIFAAHLATCRTHKMDRDAFGTVQFVCAVSKLAAALPWRRNGLHGAGSTAARMETRPCPARQGPDITVGCIAVTILSLLRLLTESRADSGAECWQIEAGS